MRWVVKNSPWCLQGLDEGEPRWSELPGNTFLLNFAVFHVASTRPFGFRARRLLLPVRNSLDQHHIKRHFVLNIFREVWKVKTRTETPRKTAIEGESFLLRLLRTASLCVFHVSHKKCYRRADECCADSSGEQRLLGTQRARRVEVKIKKAPVLPPPPPPLRNPTHRCARNYKNLRNFLAKKKRRKAHSPSGFGSITRERN